MARTIGKLTALAVTRASKRGYVADGGGLYLQISPSGSKSWVFRFRQGDKLREAGLGAVHTVSLTEARDEALLYRKELRQGIDPIEARKGQRLKRRLDAARSMTFRQCAEAYISAHAAAWRSPKSLVQWQGTLSTYAYPVFGDDPVQDIDTALVMRVVEPLWSEKPETASRLRGRIESILDWAAVRGYRQGENPARWRGHLDQLLPRKTKVRRVEHFTALGHQDIAAFMAELRAQEGVSARALEFAILTAARTGEALGACWSEIDLDKAVWTIPASRMKSGREHRVPLSGPVMAVIEKMAEIREGDFLFRGARPGRPLNSSAFLLLLRRMGRNDLTAHGFRSSFRDWAAECTAFASEVAELALAHSVGSAVERSYRRGDQFARRRELAEAWARYCAEGPASRVVQLARPVAAATTG